MNRRDLVVHLKLKLPPNNKQNMKQYFYGKTIVETKFFFDKIKSVYGTIQVLYR